MQYILSSYIDVALSEAEYEKLDDGSYAGKIPPCAGVISFGKTLKECETSFVRRWKIGYLSDCA